MVHEVCTRKENGRPVKNIYKISKVRQANLTNVLAD